MSFHDVVSVCVFYGIMFYFFCYPSLELTLKDKQLREEGYTGEDGIKRLLVVGKRDDAEFLAHTLPRNGMTVDEYLDDLEVEVTREHLTDIATVTLSTGLQSKQSATLLRESDLHHL